MAWLEITVGTAQMGVEEAAAALTAGGFADLVIEDQDQFEDFLEENRACWDYIDEELQEKLQGLSQIKLYLEDTDTAGMARLTALTEKLGLPMTVTEMAETDWEESWKDNYPAVEVSERLVVLPCWLAQEDHGGRLPVILDPGLTFGTGAHPSTQMVMRAMERFVQPGSHCLDLGSGSGILSITALRLGAESAVGVDIDPKAEGIARENAAYNGFAAPEFTALTGDVTADRRLMDRLKERHYDVVLVNIVADVIIHLSPVLPAFLGDSSTLICSGILDGRLADVTAALTGAGLTVTGVYEQEDWRCVTARRR
ncbi:MAG: 50S ribosomal protein L11 methyltransferase [Ruminococcaceae bacterium]|nr:50S ribosomal protein L11 methyltransferase [Oscillospiraceae bacterium]